MTAVGRVSVSASSVWFGPRSCDLGEMAIVARYLQSEKPRTIFRVALDRRQTEPILSGMTNSLAPLAPFGYIVRVENKHGDFWLGQNVYTDYTSVLTVKHNLQDTRRYSRVYVVPATEEQFNQRLGSKG